MQIRNSLKYALLGSLWLLTSTGLLCQASAQTTATLPIKNILLIHGAWADGSSWSKVLPHLTSAGLRVTAVQLPLTSLADDVAATERAIELEDGPVLLVGHSYGGTVITEAGNNPKVAGLVFVAAYAPDAGESSLSLANANPTPISTEIRPDSHGFLKLTPLGIAEDFGQDLTEIELQIVTATQGPTAGTALANPVTKPSWRYKPTWFVIAAKDRTISPDLELQEAVRMHARTVIVPTSHLAMLADPRGVAAVIKAAAGKSGKDDESVNQ